MSNSSASKSIAVQKNVFFFGMPPAVQLPSEHSSFLYYVAAGNVFVRVICFGCTIGAFAGGTNLWLSTKTVTASLSSFKLFQLACACCKQAFVIIEKSTLLPNALQKSKYLVFEFCGSCYVDWSKKGNWRLNAVCHVQLGWRLGGGVTGPLKKMIFLGRLDLCSNFFIKHTRIFNPQVQLLVSNVVLMEVSNSRLWTSAKKWGENGNTNIIVMGIKILIKFFHHMELNFHNVLQMLQSIFVDYCKVINCAFLK